MGRLKLGLLSLFLLLLFVVNGQYPYSKKINFPEQLPTQVVYDLLTDSKGYIWVGTDKGLFKFNGNRFLRIPITANNSKSISYLQEDEEGTIWCMNFYNQLFYLSNDTLKQFVINSKDIAETGTFNNVSIGKQKIWFHSVKGVYEFDKKNKHLTKSILVSSNHGDIASLTVVNDTVYAISSLGFLLTITGENFQWKKIISGGSQRLINTNIGIVGLSTGKIRNYSFVIQKGVMKMLPPYSTANDVFLYYGKNVGKQELWICSQKGAYLCNPATGELKCQFPNERVSSVIKDYQGNYWFGTLDNGIYICSSLGNLNYQIYQDPYLNNQVKLGLLPSGNLIVGNTQGMLAELNLSNFSVFNFETPPLREIEFIKYDKISQGFYTNRGLYLPNRKKPIESTDYSKGIDRDRFGNLIVAVFNGAYLFNSNAGSINRFPKINCPLYEKIKAQIGNYNTYTKVLLIRQKRALTVLSNQNQEGFWVAYEDALYYYRYDGRIENVKDSNGKPLVAKTLFQQPNGNLIVGTATGGVYFFNENQQIKQFTTKEGLSSNSIRKVFLQNQKLWVLTDEGFDQLDLKTQVILSYIEEQGLFSDYINDFVIVGNDLYFATNNGLLKGSVFMNKSNYEIKFPKFFATSLKDTVSNFSKLANSSNEIIFHFDAIHYFSSSPLKYQYRLKGIDKYWQELPGNINELTFTRLAPGKYVFEMKAIAGSHYQSETKHLNFEVPVPYWKNPWFIFLMVLFGASIILLVMYGWKKRIVNTQTIKEKLLKSQLVAIRSQMNPHFLYNVLNTVQGLVYGNRKKEAGELLGDFSDLMRKTLEGSDKQFISLANEIENLKLYLTLEKARFEKDFQFNIIIDPTLETEHILIPSLLIQPFVENAVKHGLLHKAGLKEINIYFNVHEKYIQVGIDDNGIGRKASLEINKRSVGKPNSFATNALEERVSLFNQLYRIKISLNVIDKLDASQESSGTYIELLIPKFINETDPE